MRGEVAEELEHSRKVQELMAGCIKRHFESIPDGLASALCFETLLALRFTFFFPFFSLETKFEKCSGHLIQIRMVSWTKLK
jgi:hypothetical protein